LVKLFYFYLLLNKIQNLSPIYILIQSNQVFFDYFFKIIKIRKTSSHFQTFLMFIDQFRLFYKYPLRDKTQYILIYYFQFRLVIYVY